MFKIKWPWSKSEKALHHIVTAWALSMSLLDLSPEDHLTIGDVLNGILILGATGSGKTTGSGQTFGLSFLRAGFGGLVLCAKSDERRIWQDYCDRAGRSGDVIVFGADQPWRFNFIDYELNRKGAGAGHIENLINLFSTILEIAERNAGQGGGREDEGYWRRSNRQLCRNLVDLLVTATGHASIPQLYRLVISAPTSREEFASKEWQASSFCFQCLMEGEKRTRGTSKERDFSIVADYWCLEFPQLSEKTRSIVVSTFTSMVDVLNRGLLGELFCTTTNFTPEMIPEGKIVIVDLPVLEFAELGQFANVLLKYTFQRAMLRRNIEENLRPVFLWQDEAQYFTTVFDSSFQATCRGFRVANVLLSQNISNFYATLGEGQKGQAMTDSLFGNLNLKVFHGNGDPVTNEWASKVIGQTKQFMINANNSYDPQGGAPQYSGSGSSHSSAGVSEQYQFEVPPSEFTRLRNGGPINQWKVDSIVFSSNLWFNATGRSWMPVTFKQK